MLLFMLWLRFVIRYIFQNISRLTVQCLADCIQGRESDCFCLVILQDRQVRQCDVHIFRQLRQPDLTLRHHYIQINYDCHIKPAFLHRKVILFLVINCLIKYKCQHFTEKPRYHEYQYQRQHCHRQIQHGSQQTDNCNDKAVGSHPL